MAGHWREALLEYEHIEVRVSVSRACDPEPSAIQSPSLDSINQRVLDVYARLFF